jgi:hypothetical protein
MKTVFLKGTLFVFISLPWILSGQNIFVLEKANKKRNIKYYAGSQISLETGIDKKFSGRITQITDSSLIINNQNEIMITDISKIYRKRWGFGLLQRVSIIGGILYLSISSLNRVINNEDPVIPEETLIISGSMILFGILMTPLSKRSHSINTGQWRVIILDFSD